MRFLPSAAPSSGASTLEDIAPSITPVSPRSPSPTLRSMATCSLISSGQLVSSFMERVLMMGSQSVTRLSYCGRATLA